MCPEDNSRRSSKSRPCAACRVASRPRLWPASEVKRSKLYDWCAAWERYGEQAFPGPGRRPGSAPRIEIGRESEANVAALERKIGQQTIAIDFLKQALQRVKDLRRPSIVSGASGSPK